MKKGIKIFIEISIGILLILFVILGMRYYKNNISSAAINNHVIEEQAVPLTEVEDTKQEEDTKETLNLDEKDEIEDEPKASSVNMVFTGDVLLTDYLISQYDKGGITQIVSEDVLEHLVQADLCMVNEEFPFSNRGTKAPDKQFTFRVDPKRVNLISELGADIVSLANNHTLDYGEEALLDTLDTLNGAGIDYVGAGNNLEEARAAKTYEINGKSIGILSASRVIPVPDWAAGSNKPGLNITYDPTNLINDIQSINSECDLVVVFVHWGIERAEHPEEYQRTMAKQYIDAGADIVIGAHPHVLQGIEYYNGKPIVYSLGNFIFGSQISKTTILNVVLNEDNALDISLIPCKTDSDYRLFAIDDNKKEIFDYIESISYGIKIDDNGMVSSE